MSSRKEKSEMGSVAYETAGDFPVKLVYHLTI